MSHSELIITEAPAPDPWVVFEYEVEMFFAARYVLRYGVTDNEANWPWIRNALSESAVLHTRILIDILLSRKQGVDDILLCALLPDHLAMGPLKPLVKSLDTAYGKGNERNSAHWAFNKMLAHPTLHRIGCFDYTSLVSQVDPIIISLLREISRIVKRPSFEALLSRFLLDA